MIIDTNGPSPDKLLPEEVRLHIKPYLKREERNEMLRSLAEVCDGKSFENIYLSHLRGGKPFFKHSEIHFSLSHTADKILAAFARFAIGVDVEMSTRKVSFEAVARRYFDPLEYAFLATCSEADMQSMFFRMWVRKEAAVKLTGEGLALGLRKVRVDPTQEGWPIYREKEKLFVKEVIPWPGAIGAVVARRQFSVTLYSEF
jgi:4'-phosphopantetheinyl transferase